jgi:hypothetical protein
LVIDSMWLASRVHRAAAYERRRPPPSGMSVTVAISSAAVRSGSPDLGLQGPPVGNEHAFGSVSDMHSEPLDHLSARHAVFVATAMHMQHPRNDYQRWRRDWAEINRLVEEINRLAALQPRPK